MGTFPTSGVIAASRQLGVQVQVPRGFDGARLMLAIAAVESGGADPGHAGHDCGPRLEPAYDVNGSFWAKSPIQQNLVKQHGRAAACSYGPWQMMFCNFSTGLKPEDLESSLETCAQEFVRYFNRRMARFSPVTLDQFGEIWNTGREIPDLDYTSKLARAYAATEKA